MVDATVIQHRRKPSIVFRLTASVFVILLMGASAALWSAWNYGTQAANEAYDRLLTGAAIQIAERVSISEGRLLVDVPVSAFELLALARDDRVFYRVIGVNGDTLTGYDDLPLPPQSAEPGSAYETSYSGEPVRAVSAARPIAERALTGQVVVVVAQTIAERTALARDIAVKAAILVGLASLAILALAYGAVRYALKPLTRVEQALLARDPNDLSPFDIETPREIETVVDAINRFTRRLDRRVTAVQSFVADAAHQLRTPITAIRAQAQLAAGENSPDRLRRISARILDRSIAVSRLADQLLSHAMVTHRTDLELRERLDLRRIAMEAEQETRRFAVDGDILVQLDLPDDEVTVAGDRFSLREAVKNLINNAHAHGKPPVSVRVNADGGMASVAVLDHGEGIDKAARPTAGTRFRQQGEGSAKGTSLGLAIAHEVALAHGGTLGFADHEDGRFEVHLRLPVTGAGR